MNKLKEKEYWGVWYQAMTIPIIAQKTIKKFTLGFVKLRNWEKVSVE
jgi:hypothetical protein